MVEKIYVQRFLSDGSLNENEADITCLPLRSYDESHLAVTNIDGLAPMAGTINLDDNAGADGSIFNSARAQNRNIVITMKPFYEDGYDFDGNYIRQSMEVCRRKIYLIFPLKKKVRLKFETESRTYYIDGYVETINADYFGDLEGAQVSILCPDPYFKVDWEDVVPPDTSEGFLLSEQGKYYGIDMSMHNSDGRYYYLDHNIPMIITFILRKDVNKADVSIGCGLDPANLEFMLISNMNFKQYDQIVINTKTKTVDWIGERFDSDGNPIKQYRNALPFTSFNSISPIEYFEYYIPGNNPYIDRIGKHRLLFNNWFVFDKDAMTYFVFFAQDYIPNTDPEWQNNTYYELIDNEYKLLTEEPANWSTNYTDYYVNDQTADVVIKPILEYEGV